jgi:hypothetical protein
MTRRGLPIAACTAVFTILLITGCSNDGETTGPGVTPVSMSGNLDFPGDTLVHMEDILVGLGDCEEGPDSLGSFSIRGNPEAPGLLMACDQDTIPYLLAVLPQPSEGLALEMNARTTALALAFMYPLVCVGECEGAGEVLSILDDLPEMDELEGVLEAKLATDPRSLSIEDAEIDSALSHVISAYFSSYETVVARYHPMSAAVLGLGSGEEVYILPDHQYAGLDLNHVKDDKFILLNYLGRWATCITPDEQFYIWPNGTLFDWVRGEPFPPSSREITLDIEPNKDPVEVKVYGWGWYPADDNRYDNLTSEEQSMVCSAGMMTVVTELVPHFLSTISNTRKLSGLRPKKDQEKFIAFVKLIMKTGRYGFRMQQYIREGKIVGLLWFLTKGLTKELATNQEIRAKFLELMKVQLSDGALKRVAGFGLKYVAAPLVVADSFSALAKTTLGFSGGRFKTTFQIWKEVVEFGHVQGTVFKKKDGTRMQGVAVTLEGDEGNPVNPPPHNDVTDGQGLFYFENIQVGSKTLRFSKDGYKPKSVPITIVKDQTITVDVEMEEEEGGVTGRIINEILWENDVDPPLFQGTVLLLIDEIGGEHRHFTKEVHNGLYTIGLPTGRYWLKATHEDYHPDSLEVEIEEDETVPAGRDLILSPRVSVTATVDFDMNNDGIYESSVAIPLPHFGASMPAIDWSCPAGQPGGIIQIVGVEGTFPDDFDDIVMIAITTDLLDGSPWYSLGGIEGAGCPATGVVATLFYATTRYMCHYTDGNDYAQAFSITYDPGDQHCNCGITDYGTVAFSEIGTELADPVKGHIIAGTLAGWKTCHCACKRRDQYGNCIESEVECARARLNLEFTTFVGTDYMLPPMMNMNLAAPVQRSRILPE